MSTSEIHALPQKQTNLPVSTNSIEVEWDNKYCPDNDHYCDNATAEMQEEDKKGRAISGFGTPGLDFSPLGTMKINIIPLSKNGTKLVSWSEANSNWHIKSGRDSQLSMSVEISNITIPDGTFFVRLVLVRKNADYQEIPVDILCDKHAYPNDLEDKLRVIQPAPEFNGTFWYSSGARRSLCVGCHRPKKGCIMIDIDIKLICMDTCQNSSMVGKLREGARDLVLVATLECKDLENGITIIARNNAPIWPKKQIAKRELFKTTRRLPKGMSSRGQRIRPHEQVMVNENWMKFEWLCKNATVVGLSLGLSKHDMLRRFRQFQEMLSTQ